VEDIDWIESGHNYVTLRIGRQSYKMRGTLHSIELKLPKDKFARLSRFNIVQIDRIKEFEPFASGIAKSRCIPGPN
jgi:DNA-binding LytR/AlgR family response regulator